MEPDRQAAWSVTKREIYMEPPSSEERRTGAWFLGWRPIIPRLCFIVLAEERMAHFRKPTLCESMICFMAQPEAGAAVATAARCLKFRSMVPRRFFIVSKVAPAMVPIRILDWSKAPGVFCMEQRLTV